MNPKIKLPKSLQFDKEVIGKLQEKQMEHILGGINAAIGADLSRSCSCIHHSCVQEPPPPPATAR
ncbi:class I lanthipeptide [Chitinophaga sp. S165]|uniref:class I lanthipeptide n=1 Tax=Chitinophaga sp. S165 TaxID=2135462 RepID=UPI000D91518B|nr:class I lanthipeptide [Chitinophaga sp. S165]PWV51813.1 hypothetical protein C7475_103423 [Chitinophaga sp. S165]